MQNIFLFYDMIWYDICDKIKYLYKYKMYPFTQIPLKGREPLDGPMPWKEFFWSHPRDKGCWTQIKVIDWTAKIILGSLHASVVLKKIVTVATWQARWLRLLYIDFSHFTRDQEYLISLKGEDGNGPTNGFNYVEGFLLTNESMLNNWTSSTSSRRNSQRISSLLAQHGMIYCLELSKYYSDHSSVDQVHPSFKFWFSHFSLPFGRICIVVRVFFF